MAKKKGTTDYPIRVLIGVDDTIAEKLEEQEITTTKEFLEMCITRNDRQILTDLLDIHEGDILTMANMADLLRIETITPPWAWLLEKVGVDTIPELAQRNPERLYQAIEEYDIAFLDDVNDKPTGDDVKEWVARAKEMERFLKY
ncbi:MAG: DUF4332 domain-containing protein [Candidatus Thermoplasmatota archaeon]|jgi:hypothetical protein|nr:DUF4332 domain-containing protein [Candidatus Thermoplasmatota archaeon]MDP7265672.1 DUF4332 domain-containing protein [Candidatus Thermoplasmatota archaeon]MDP7420289.1 DUF4332 domain-containing protein [bacterium]